jgi:haloalkane dehalogenase
MQDYTYARHVDWVTSWMRVLDLARHHRGGAGLGFTDRSAGCRRERRSVLEVVHRQRFSPDRRQGDATRLQPLGCLRRALPWFDAGRIVGVGTTTRLSSAVRAGYNAPFPDKRYQAGARVFPALVPTTPSDPAVPANRKAWEVLGRVDKPVLCVFGNRDPILGKADKPLIGHIPGAAGQPHARIDGGHFVQEDAGPELARRLLDWEAGL